MTSMHLQPSFEAPRPMSQQGFHSSPAISPKPPHRSASQASLHLAPVSTNNFPPPLDTSSANHTGIQNGPLTSFPGQFRPFTPASMTLPIPNTAYSASYPTTAPPVSYFPSGPSPIYDTRGLNGHGMMRTYSHAHPMHSATEQTPSTRYSPSPRSAGGNGLIHHESPPSASFNHNHNHDQHSAYPMSAIQQPTINIQDENQGRGGHINPSLFNNSHSNHLASYPMSRSTSGASAISDNGTNPMMGGGRLLTPHYEYRDSHEDLRRVSDPSMGMTRDRLYPASYAPAPSYQAQSGHGLGLGPHPQPTEVYFRGNPYAEYAMSSERADVKPNLTMLHGGHAETDYERERQEQIMNNKRLLEDIGLGGGGGGGGGGGQGFRGREASNGAGRRNRKPTLNKKRSSYNGPVRQSGRIASVSRTSYANLDGNEEGSNSSDEYSDNGDQYEEDEFRPSKKPRGRTTYAQRSFSSNKPRRSVELSLWGLLQVYPEIPHLFPLFYYTLNNDLTINPESVPLIGSISSTCTPVEKAEGLRKYFHKGRRVLAQLDTFTTRCDRKYDGPDDRWPEMGYHTRIAVRDVRRKIVERCENYKYTRRDILDKVVGKGKWSPIEDGLVNWDPESGTNDPAGDLANVTLTLPTPPASAYHQQHQQPRVIPQNGVYPQHPHSATSHMGLSSGRTIRGFPRRAASSAHHNNNGLSTPGMPMSASSNLGSARIMSVNMDGVYSPMPPITANGVSYFNPPAPPMYGEDEVPMSVQLPSASLQAPQQQQQQQQVPMMSPMPQTPAMVVTPVPQTTVWDSSSQTPIPSSTPLAESDNNTETTPRGIKRSRSEEEADSEPDNNSFDGDDFTA